MEHYDLNDLVCMKYAPMTSVYVERSLFKYEKKISIKKGMGLNESNLTVTYSRKLHFKYLMLRVLKFFFIGIKLRKCSFFS